MPEEFQAWLDAHRVDPEAIASDAIVPIGHITGEMASLVARLRNPEIVAAAGSHLPRGILLTGAPGTGKTTSARWLARQIGGVPMWEVSADELTPARVRSLFAALAGTNGVMYVDDIDIIGMDSRWGQHSERSRQTLSAMITCMDGMRSSPDPLVIASTTRDVDRLEPALVRAGRLGIHIEVAPPTEEERRRLLERRNPEFLASLEDGGQAAPHDCHNVFP